MSNQTRKNSSGIIKFFSELYMLKRIKRAGWNVLDAPQDSIADHVAATAQIAYVLAKMEGLNAKKCAVMALFHDNDETRIGDLHKVATLYLEKDSASLRALKDQLKNLPKAIEQEILKLIAEERDEETPEAIVARDADWLEMAFQAKILKEKGYKGAKDWFVWTKEHLQTKSAKRILAEAEAIDDFTGCWWKAEREQIINNERGKKGGKKIKRTKRRLV